MIVARPIGIVPMNIETVLCPNIRRASCPNMIQRVAYRAANSAKRPMLNSHSAAPTGFSVGPMPGTCGRARREEVMRWHAEAVRAPHY